MSTTSKRASDLAVKVPGACIKDAAKTHLPDNYFKAGGSNDIVRKVNKSSSQNATVGEASPELPQIPHKDDKSSSQNATVDEDSSKSSPTPQKFVTPTTLEAKPKTQALNPHLLVVKDDSRDTTPEKYATRPAVQKGSLHTLAASNSQHKEAPATPVLGRSAVRKAPLLDERIRQPEHQATASRHSHSSSVDSEGSTFSSSSGGSLSMAPRGYMVGFDRERNQAFYVNEASGDKSYDRPASKHGSTRSSKRDRKQHAVHPMAAIPETHDVSKATIGRLVESSESRILADMTNLPPKRTVSWRSNRPSKELLGRIAASADSKVAQKMQEEEAVMAAIRRWEEEKKCIQLSLAEARERNERERQYKFCGYPHHPTIEHSTHENFPSDGGDRILISGSMSLPPGTEVRIRNDYHHSGVHHSSRRRIEHDNNSKSSLRSSHSSRSSRSSRPSHSSHSSSSLRHSSQQPPPPSGDKATPASPKTIGAIPTPDPLCKDPEHKAMLARQAKRERSDLILKSMPMTSFLIGASAGRVLRARKRERS